MCIYKYLIGVFILLLQLSAVAEVRRGAAAEKEPQKLSITVYPAGFNTDVRSLLVVLQSASDEITRYCDVKVSPINIRYNGDVGPIVLFRNKKSEHHNILLSSRERYWCQYIFQFSHELCHILSGHRNGENPNLWFEESLCEMTAVFTLKRMARRWKTDPPYWRWKSYSKSIQLYCDKIMEKAKLKSSRRNARKWFRSNLKNLQAAAEHHRFFCTLIGVNILLPYFENNPHAYSALPYLNVGENARGADVTFQSYLQNWRNNTPERYTKYVDGIAREFGYKLQDISEDIIVID